MLSHSPVVGHGLKLPNFHTDYCKVLKFTEYSEQNGVYLSSFYTHGPGSLATLWPPDHADENLFLETTDRNTDRTDVVARRIDDTSGAEEQGDHTAAIRRSRPIVTHPTDRYETAAFGAIT